MSAPDVQRIDALGGPATLARLLGYAPDAGGVQRVFNWKRRGIPAAVKVQHPELLLAPLEQAKAVAEARLAAAGNAGSSEGAASAAHG